MLYRAKCRERDREVKDWYVKSKEGSFKQQMKRRAKDREGTKGWIPENCHDRTLKKKTSHEQPVLIKGRFKLVKCSRGAR